MPDEERIVHGADRPPAEIARPERRQIGLDHQVAIEIEHPLDIRRQDLGNEDPEIGSMGDVVVRSEVAIALDIERLEPEADPAVPATIRCSFASSSPPMFKVMARISKALAGLFSSRETRVTARC